MKTFNASILKEVKYNYLSQKMSDNNIYAEWSVASVFNKNRLLRYDPNAAEQEELDWTIPLFPSHASRHSDRVLMRKNVSKASRIALENLVT